MPGLIEFWAILAIAIVFIALFVYKNLDTVTHADSYVHLNDLVNNKLAYNNTRVTVKAKVYFDYSTVMYSLRDDNGDVIYVTGLDSKADHHEGSVYRLSGTFFAVPSCACGYFVGDVWNMVGLKTVEECLSQPTFECDDGSYFFRPVLKVEEMLPV